MGDRLKLRPMTLVEYKKLVEMLDKTKQTQNEAPEVFFFCSVGGIAPICSDCKRNHLNSRFRSEDISNWYNPQHTSNFRACEGYIQTNEQ